MGSFRRGTVIPKGGVPCECTEIYTEIAGGDQGGPEPGNEYSNMQIEQLHLLGALTREDEGLTAAAAQGGGGPYRLPVVT